MAIQHQPAPVSRPKPYVFQSPATPSTALSTPHTSYNTSTRKRSRGDVDNYFTTPYSTSFAQTPYSAGANGWSTLSNDSSIRRSINTASPVPLANEKYRIKGGVDTPTLTAITRYEDTGHDEESFRRGWSASGNFMHDADHDGQPSREAISQDGQTGKRRLEEYQNGEVKPVTWGKTLLSVATGVAGIVVEFCRFSAAPFRGFYAGGGAGYSHGVNELGAESIWQEAERSMSLSYSHIGTPIPGQWEQYDEPDQREEEERPSKRGKSNDGSGWVLIEPKQQTKESTPSQSTKGSGGSAHRSRAARASGGPLHRPMSRRSMIPVSRRSPTVSVNIAGSPSNRGHPRSPRGPPSPVRLNAHQSPMSPEAAQFKARVQREEREHEASMRKMNKQLQQMIKEGRQALGTKFVVEDEFE